METDSGPDPVPPAKSLLLFAATTGYQTRSFAAAAQRLGVNVTLATDRCHVLDDPWRDQALPVRFEEPEQSARTLASLPALKNTGGIVAVADRPALMAALTAEKLGLAWHLPSAVAACRDKHRLREIFELAGLLVPRNFRVLLDANPAEIALRVEFPCVLKPLGLSASRGVIRANDEDEFVAAFERIRRILQRPEIQRQKEEWNEAIQIEGYITGREFALEGLVTHGAVTVLALFDKPDPLEGPFFEETIYTTPSREPIAVQDAIVAATRRAIEGIGLTHGPIHAEMRVNAKGVYMLEVAARPIGGLCARALQFTSPAHDQVLNLEDLVILHAVGDMPQKLSPRAPAAGVMMIPIPAGGGIYQSVTGVEEARTERNVDDVVITAKPGQKLVPLPEGASYLGFIFSSGADAAAVEASLRRAHQQLKFEMLATLNVIPL